MQDLAELRCEVLARVMNADHSAILRAKNALEKMETAVVSPQKTLKSTKRQQEYFYSYRPAKDTLTETASGKNVRNIVFSKDEFLKLAEVFVGLINSKGIFQADEGHYKKSGYSLERIRAAFRICIQLGVMKKTYMSGRLYSATGHNSGFLFAVEQAWKERGPSL
jgi:hypothetical protein